MADTTSTDARAIVKIPLDKIKPSPYQARKHFEEPRLKALAKSMQDEGQLEPILVRDKGDYFEIIFGERRWRAAALAGLQALDAQVIKTVSEAEAAAKGLLENMMREELDPIEEAEGFNNLNKLDGAYWTHDRIAEIAGQDRTYVTKSISLLSLPEAIKDNVRQRTLTREHSIELMRINNANSQKGMANKIIKGGWSVKQTRTAIDRKLAKGNGGSGASGKQGAAEKSSTDPLKTFWDKARLVMGDESDKWQWNMDYDAILNWKLEFCPLQPDGADSAVLAKQLGGFLALLGTSLAKAGEGKLK
jgi:ParB family chromosome partitioning protein